MKNKLNSLFKSHWAKFLSVLFFILLLASYINIFAVGEPYAPGTMLDPSCGPLDPDCTVTISSGGTPSGSSGGIQFNDNGTFNSSTGFTWVGGTGDPFSIGPDVVFTKADGATITTIPEDVISQYVHIKRGSARSIYNSVTESSYNNDNSSPAGTAWNVDGWDDLSDIESREYTSFNDATNGDMDELTTKEFVMHDTGDGKYYKIHFTSWSAGGAGGFAYVRNLIDTDDFSLGSNVPFTKANSTFPTDVISPHVQLTRAGAGGLYNPLSESSYDGWSTADTWLAPTGTEWNSDGWGDLTDVDTRTYTTFYEALDEEVGNNILDAELVMHDIDDDKYYKFDFTAWTQSANDGGGGGFSYTRNIITLANGTTNQLTISGNILLEGLGRYLNFNTDSGEEGYGIRDSGGVIEYKNLAGDWTPFGGSNMTYSGSGTEIALTNSPVFTNPSLGIATATSVNGVSLSTSAGDTNFLAGDGSYKAISGGSGLSSDADFNTKGGTNAGLNLVAGAQYNTFLGYEAGKSASAGGTNLADYNTAIGYQSLYSNTNGSNNTANGNSSLYSNTAGFSNTANGNGSLYYNTIGGYNTANGMRSLYSNTGGNSNTANGVNSLYSNTTGSNNTANGFQSLYSNKANNRSTAIGYKSMYYADDRTSGQDTYNTALGYEALKGSSTAANNTGQYNTAIGDSALYSNTTGAYNTANGFASLYSNTTGNYNTANGMDSLYFNTTGSNNTANGLQSLYLNTTGYNNTANGSYSLRSNTTGNFNTANGNSSLNSNTTGNFNTANGYQSLYSNTTGSTNTANGMSSLYSNTTGASNTASGTNSLYSNTTGYNNTSNGNDSLNSNTTGNSNTANGVSSLNSNTTGYGNTANGVFSLFSNTTGTYNIGLGYDARALADGDTNEIVIGASAIGNGSNTATIGNTSTLRTYLTGLNLKAGSATAGTAPLKFTSSAGALLGTTEGGAVEYDGSHLYFTATDNGTRFQLDQQGGGGLSSDADYNTKGGTSAGLNLVSGAQYNTFLGYEAGKGGVVTNAADNNTAIGYQSLYSNTTGSENTTNGYQSLYSNATGYQNTANGYYSLYYNTTGNNNTANGVRSLYSNTTGSYNTANGNQSLFLNTTGSNNTANGTFSLYSNTTGSNNTANGYNSGKYIANGSTPNTTGDYNVFLGPEIRALADDDQNEIVIGASAIGNGSDTTTIGNTSTLRTYLTGLNLKAGTATAGTAPLKFTSSAGTLLGTTEAGAVEYDGSHLYFTATDSGTRFQLDQQGGGGLSSDADYNTKGGTNAGLNLVSGAQYNTFLGYEAGKSGAGTSTNDADNNTAIGYRSLYNNTTGSSNTANGYNSLYSNTTGFRNTANGSESLLFNTTGFQNTANGSQSLFSNTTGNGNTANGYLSLFSNTTGVANTANGNESLFSNTTGYQNTANGYQSLYSNTTGNGNTANGYQSLYFNTTGYSNTANGNSSLSFNTTGHSNTANGMQSLYYNKANSRSTAIGYNSMYYADNRTSGRDTYNTAIGYEALKGSATAANNTGQYNTAIGDSALYSNTTGYVNTANGYQSLYSNTTGSNNTANGMNSLYSNTTGESNTANGSYSLYSNTFGNYNTANGYLSLNSNTTGSFNTANGSNSLYSNKANRRSTAIGYQSMYYADDRTSGQNTYNTAVGYEALKGSTTAANNTGQYNTAIGDSALYSNTTGSSNTANGFESLYYNTTGSNNTANGTQSLYFNTTGGANIANGNESLYSNTTGFSNTANGYFSLNSNTTGTYNIGLGYEAGDYISGGAISNTTGDYNVFLGSKTKALADDDQNEIVIGYNTTGNGTNTTTIGTGNVLYVGGGSVTGMVARFTNGTGSCDINPTTSSIGCASDMRLKKNITTLDKENIDFVLRQDIEMPSTTLDKILTLTPVTYNWNLEENNTTKHIGFIAQEMEQIFPDLVATDDKTGLKSIFYTNLIPYTIEAIQEMNLKVEELSSLDVLNENSLASLIRNFLESATNGIKSVFFGEVHTKQLCIDGEGGESLCITKDQLQQILDSSSVNPSPTNTESSSPADVVDDPTMNANMDATTNTNDVEVGGGVTNNEETNTNTTESTTTTNEDTTTPFNTDSTQSVI